MQNTFVLSGAPAMSWATGCVPVHANHANHANHLCAECGAEGSKAVRSLRVHAIRECQDGYMQR